MIKRKLFAFDRSSYMRELHKSGRYLGTSKIGTWNKSEEKKSRMKDLRMKNALDKNSRGYGSEYHMRLSNRELLHNKFQGKEGYLYFLEFPASIKVGFSKNYEGRVSYLGGKILEIVTGPTNELADLEFDIFINFKEYTQLDPTGSRYTEFMDSKIKNKVKKFIEDRVNSSEVLNFVK